MRVVVLDDHPAMLQVIENSIRKVVAAAKILSFQELAPALEYIAMNVPDYVVADIQIFSVKQTEVLEMCYKFSIPYAVYTSHVNPSIIKMCNNTGCKVFVSKTAPLQELETGLRMLLVQNKSYRCSVTEEIMQRRPEDRHELPKALFNSFELPVILAQISGESTVDLAARLGKGLSTIRNQRIKLMHKNDCSMEEIARRYLYWNSEG